MSLIDKINELALLHKDDFEGTSESVPDWFIANKLNEQPATVVQKYVPIVCKDIKGMLIIGGEYAVIKELSLNGTNPIKALCVNVLEALNGFDELDMNNPSYLIGYGGIADNLETAGIISSQTKQILLSLIVQSPVTEYSESWATLNNIIVDSRVVGIARGANPGGSPNPTTSTTTTLPEETPTTSTTTTTTTSEPIPPPIEGE